MAERAKELAERIQSKVKRTVVPVACDVHNYRFDTAGLITSLKTLTKRQVYATLQSAVDRVRQLILSYHLSANEEVLWLSTLDKGYNANATSGTLKDGLQDILNYLESLSQKDVRGWMEGFIGEAAHAYDGPSPISCVRGIQERSFSGLRNITGLPEGVGKFFKLGEFIKEYKNQDKMAFFASKPANYIDWSHTYNNSEEKKEAWIQGVSGVVGKAALDAGIGGNELVVLINAMLPQLEDFGTYIEWDDLTETDVTPETEED